MDILSSLPQFTDSGLGLGPRQIVNGLKVEPELRGCIERMSEEPGSLGGNTSLPTNDLIYSLSGHANVLSESHLSNLEWAEKLALQDLARMSRDSVFRKHGGSPFNGNR